MLTKEELRSEIKWRMYIAKDYISLVIRIVVALLISAITITAIAFLFGLGFDFGTSIIS